MEKKHMKLNELPQSWQRHIRELRLENARFRWECKELRTELEAVRNETKANDGTVRT